MFRRCTLQEEELNRYAVDLSLKACEEVEQFILLNYILKILKNSTKKLQIIKIMVVRVFQTKVLILDVTHVRFPDD